MIDFHCHTFLSDGELCPAELVRRVEVKGFRVIGMSDHVDNGTLEPTLAALVRAVRELSSSVKGLRILAGCELTHCRPEQIGDLVQRARKAGADYVICHGETLVEPVMPGTNRAAIEAGVDYLAHPGLLSEADAHLAADRGVLLELSGRRGHSLTNGHVASLARRTGAGLVFGSDSHSPGDFMDRGLAERVLAGAGLSAAEVAAAFERAEVFASSRLDGRL